MKRRDAANPVGASSLSSKKPDTLAFVTLGAVVVMLAISLVNMWTIRRVERTLADRVSKLEARATGRPATTGGPDPNRIYNIKVDGSPTKGPMAAPVTIAEFSEFQCPFCLKVNPTLQRIAEVYEDKVRIVWKHLPLSFHKDAMNAALASEAAANQGKFWEYHDKLFANQEKLEIESLKQYARELQLDMKRFENDMSKAEVRKRIDSDSSEARALGITGTPGFFINGRFLRGAQPFEAISRVVDEELVKLNQPIPPKS
jgi:protein-disulfide isomerase